MRAIDTIENHPASFRDNSGYIFYDSDGSLLRRVKQSYLSDYHLLMESGLYDELTNRGLLVEHTLESSSEDELVIRPRRIEFISYPYEWAFSALKNAALLTLEIQTIALKHGMTLKDATAFNVQFEGTRPIFIDTLSFEKQREGAAWNAYGQFCRHFLAPLALAAKTDMRLTQLLTTNLDGIPLDLASKLLGRAAKLRPGLMIHLVMHAKMVARHSNSKDNVPQKAKSPNLSEAGMTGLLESLRKTISKLSLSAKETEWVDYYSDNSYSDEGFLDKKRVVGEFIARIEPRTVWDLGANTGVFSKIAVQQGAQSVTAYDIDRACVEVNYRERFKSGETSILPLFLDLTNPTPAVGWNLEERNSFLGRAPVDAVMALALIHHIAISNNVSLEMAAKFFHGLGKSLVIEFVPKSDPQVQRLLRSREDIFDDYDTDGFVAAFEKYFHVVDQKDVGSDGRILFLMNSRES